MFYFDCWDCSLIAEIAVWLLRLQSDCGDCSLIAEIAVWLWRLPSGMSGMREISERKANALNFLNPVLSTNQRPRFWALNQWEASLQFLRFWLTYKIKLQSQQSDSHLSNQTAIWAIRLQSSYTVVWLWRLQSDCRDAVKLRRLYTNYWDCKHNWCNLTAMQEDCSLIAEIAVWMWRLPSGMSGTREIFWTKG